jgi:hypothetical protein
MDGLLAYPQLPPQIVERIVGFLDAGIEIAGIKTRLASGASEMRVGL